MKLLIDENTTINQLDLALYSEGIDCIKTKFRDRHYTTELFSKDGDFTASGSGTTALASIQAAYYNLIGPNGNI